MIIYSWLSLGGVSVFCFRKNLSKLVVISDSLHSFKKYVVEYLQNTATFTQNERTKQPESKRTTTIRFRPQSTVSFASIGNRLFLKSLISCIILPTIFFLFINIFYLIQPNNYIGIFPLRYGNGNAIRLMCKVLPKWRKKKNEKSIDIFSEWYIAWWDRWILRSLA